MTRIRHALTAAVATAFLLAGDAIGQENRPYLSFSGLYVMPSASEVETEAGGYDLASDLTMRNGFGFAVALGYGSDTGLRGELEIGHRSVDFEEFDGFRVTGQDVDVSFEGKLPYEGSLRLWTVMANGIFAAEIWRVRPYFGGGIGVAFAKAAEDAQSWAVNVDGSDETISSEGGDANDTLLAYQAMVGIGYPLSEAVEVRLGYRYFGTGEGDYDGLKASFSSHNVEAGIRFTF